MKNSQELANFVPSARDPLYAVLSSSDMKAGGKFVDIGAGDGRVVFRAVREFPGIKAVAIEMNKERAAFIQRRADVLGLGGRIEVIRGNVFDYDIADCTAAAAYLTPWGNARLKPYLEEALKGTATFVSEDFPIVGWKPARTVRVPVSGFYVNYLRLLQHPACALPIQIHTIRQYRMSHLHD